MYNKYKLRILLSVILAILASYLIYVYLERVQQKEPIVAAKQAIEPYTKLTEEMLTVLYINKEDKALLFPHGIKDPKDIAGTVARVRFEKNQPIEKKAQNLVFGEDETLVLNYQGQVDNAYFIPYERRVIAVDVDASGSLNFSLRKGDFVDIIYTSVDDSTGGAYSSMMLQHMQIFDIEDVRIEKGASGFASKKQNVLLLAKPDECLKLSVAKRNGQIDLVLNPLNGETGDVEPVHLLDFAAYKPIPKSEMLKVLEEQIKIEDISAPVKKDILANIDKERSVESMRNAVEASKLPKEVKMKIMELLK
ncbi:Flp pilus assembly protein CpaB [Lutispora sp.]|uniref:Flp pilus assembly protein CpaB n=1 Tax=Lutispora sp. TaxID=2828727 RepID=UPI002B2092F1|nr:RcpC/CpaB family pilus assembly protein [Lutispora sp.]MEA4963549.1 RcpC/CpaB family pilus assembly protein [Lutispora sp.]